MDPYLYTTHTPCGGSPTYLQCPRGLDDSLQRDHRLLGLVQLRTSPGIQKDPDGLLRPGEEVLERLELLRGGTDGQGLIGQQGQSFVQLGNGRMKKGDFLCQSSYATFRLDIPFLSAC